jgi:hypothetical protein
MAVTLGGSNWADYHSSGTANTSGTRWFYASGGAAPETGVIDTIYVYEYYYTAHNVICASLQGDLITLTDTENLGTVSPGSKQAFTGKSLSVNANDEIAMTADDYVTFSYNTGGHTYMSEDTRVSWSSADATHGLAFYGISTAAAPTVTTQDATDVSFSSCTGNGNVTNEGTADVTRKGFCYTEGTSGDPTTADSTVYDDGSFSTGAYTKSITGLKERTGYRVRAYAVSSVGTAYGSTVQVTTLGAPAMTMDYLGHRGRDRFRTRGVSLGTTK